MAKRIGKILSIFMAAAILFGGGVIAGRHSLRTNGYDGVTSAREVPLIGSWKIASNDVPEQWSIEFRGDRSATKYFSNGRAGLVAYWGRNGNELSLQDVHVIGEETAYIPPAVFKIIQIDEVRARLQTADGQVTWDLTRI